MTTVDRAELIELCRAALAHAGASPRDADVLADATAQAEFAGNRAVGVAHLLDYLDGYRQGRITAVSEPVVRRAAAGVVDVDARGGLAQVAFVDGLDQLRWAIHECGIAALWISHGFTCGELGYYPRRLAVEGFVALAMATSPALMSIGGAPRPVLGTNPVAYAVPRPGGAPMVIDQASSSTAFVNVRTAAQAGEPIPAGWALGPDGGPTTDAAQAMAGALLPFGGHRGGNIALLVEILATLAGATFSVEAAPFERGSVSPGIGVFVLGIDPGVLRGVEGGAVGRLADYLSALSDEHQVRMPALAQPPPAPTRDIDAELIRRLAEFD